MKKTVLITGASGGFGSEFAKIFAKNGYNLILVARNEKVLNSLKEDLKTDQNRVAVFVSDLSNPTSPQLLYNSITKSGLLVDILVNDAGFASYGAFFTLDPQKEVDQIQVNVTSLVHLTRLFLPQMIERNSGKILNVASTAAFLPGPLMATYYATKAFVLSFSEAIHEELLGTGVTVTALCPGPSKTGFVEHGGLGESPLFKKDIMDPATVARIGYAGLMRDKRVIIPGIRNRLIIETLRILPRSIVPRLVLWMQRPL